MPWKATSDPADWPKFGNSRNPFPYPLGAVAQLGERGLCKPEVVGSIPISSTNKLCEAERVSRTNREAERVCETNRQLTEPAKANRSKVFDGDTPFKFLIRPS